jgi:hypothetical protein
MNATNEIRPGALERIDTRAEGVAIVFDDMTILLTHEAWAAILYFLEG